MNVNRRVIFISAATVLLAAIAAVVFWPQSKPQQPQQQAHAPARTPKTGPSHEGAADANRLLGDAAEQKPGESLPAKPEQTAKSDAQEKDPFNYGRLPAIKADANPQVKAVVEAIRQGNHPERLSVMVRPQPFDAKSYRANPASYLDVVEPGRVFQTAQPSPGVPRLGLAGPQLQHIVQGQTATLQVRAPAGAPVSFTAFDGGQFDNQLSSVTVQANAQGIAQARLLATPGTIEDLNVLAGSPLASGQVKFVVNVQVPADAVAAR